MIDLRDPRFLADPAPTLARLRAAGPLAETRVPLVGRVRITTTDAAARALLKDPRFVRDPKGATGRTNAQRFWFLPRFMAPMLDSLILRDGADHRRLRTLVELAFARTTVDDLVPDLEAIADDLLDRMDPDRPVDLVRAYARPLPGRGIAALLGVPEADRARVLRWMASLSNIGPLTIAAALPGLWMTLRHFRRDIRSGAAGAHTRLLRELLVVEEDGHRLREDEVLSLIVLLFLAGHETTVHMISDALWSLARDPGLRDGLDDPDRLRIAVEEFFRFHSPVMMTKMMIASENLDFQGVPVRKGEQLSAFLLAANHDPDRVEDPEALLLDRRPNAHLAFGFGPHVCLGMQLARAEVRVAVRRLLERYPDFRLADPDRPPTYARRFGIRSVPKLVVRLR